MGDEDARPPEAIPGTSEAPAEPNWFDRQVDRIDDLQRRVRPAGFVVAVLKRFGEDRGSQYSAMLAYYGFFSLLAVLLVLGTVLATVLHADPARQQQVIDAITQRVPVTGNDLSTNVRQLSGSGIALVIGALATLWGGLGVVNAAQDAFNTMWGVPRHRWPNIWVRSGRSIAVLAVFGLALILVNVGGIVVALLEQGVVQQVATALLAVAVSTGGLLIVFELLTNTRVGMRVLLPGAFVGGVGLFALQIFGAWYMARFVARAGTFYGTFAAAIGVLVWISFQARLLLLASEVNVVRHRHLWPRSLSGRNLGDADQRALADAVARESMAGELVIDTRLDVDGSGEAGPEEVPGAGGEPAVSPREPGAPPR